MSQANQNTQRYACTIPADHYNILTGIARRDGFKGAPEVARQIVENHYFDKGNEFYLLSTTPVKIYSSALSSVSFTLTVCDEAGEILDRSRESGYRSPSEAVREIIRSAVNNLRNKGLLIEQK